MGALFKALLKRLGESGPLLAQLGEESRMLNLLKQIVGRNLSQIFACPTDELFQRVEVRRHG